MGSRFNVQDASTSTDDTFLSNQPPISDRTLQDCTNETQESPFQNSAEDTSRLPRSPSSAESLHFLEPPTNTNTAPPLAQATPGLDIGEVGWSDRNRNRVECESAIDEDPIMEFELNGGNTRDLEELLKEAVKEVVLLPQRQDFHVYLAKTGSNTGKATPAQSEQPSIYFDALDTVDDQRSDLEKSKYYSLESEVVESRRRSRKKWCCCCWQSRPIHLPSRQVYFQDKSTVGGESNRTDEMGSTDAPQDSAPVGRSRSLSDLGMPTSKPLNDTASGDFQDSRPSHQERRKRIPDRLDRTMSLWGILKNALSKDLTRTPLPVAFSEPLSMLQRLAESYTHSSILDKAVKCNDQFEQMCLVTAFYVGGYGHTAIRIYKPFNPLLGETFEWDRQDDLGWRYLGEQVSHHPATAATHCEGVGWTCWQDLTMRSNWHMNTIEFSPTGTTHLLITDSGHHYTWRQLTTVVHNVIMGKLWVDQTGDMVITNHKTGDTCKLTFKQQKHVVGSVLNAAGLIKWTLSGSWDEKLVGVPMLTRGNAPTGPQLLWKIKPPSPGSDKYYNMSEFACQLNELERGIAPTDSRLRPDERLMEEGYWDEANEEKSRLEEKQRRASRRWERGSEDDRKSIASVPSKPRQVYMPLWFRREYDKTTSTTSYTYTGKYWDEKEKKDWHMCPNIF